MSYYIEKFNVNNVSANLIGSDISLSENKNSLNPASCKSVNEKLSELGSKEGSLITFEIGGLDKDTGEEKNVNDRLRSNFIGITQSGNLRKKVHLRIPEGFSVRYFSNIDKFAVLGYNNGIFHSIATNTKSNGYFMEFDATGMYDSVRIMLIKGDGEEITETEAKQCSANVVLDYETDLIQRNNIFSIKGNTSKLTYAYYKGIKGGVMYRIYLCNPLIDVTNVAENHLIFSIVSIDEDGNDTNYYEIVVGKDLQDYYDFYVPKHKGLQTLRIGARMAEGEELHGYIIENNNRIDITGFVSNTKSLKVKVGDIYYDVLKKELRQVETVSTEGLSIKDIAIPFRENILYYYNGTLIEWNEYLDNARAVTSNDIDFTNFKKLEKMYINARTGNASDAGSTFVFQNSVPTLGKKYVRLSVMILTSQTTPTGMAFYDKAKNFISGIAYPTIAADTSSRGALVYTIPIPKNAAYVNATYYTDASMEEYGIEEPFKFVLTDDDGLSTLPPITGNYNRSIPLYDYNGIVGNELYNITYSELLAIFDGFMTDYPKSIKKTLIGYASKETDYTSVAEDNTDYPIYEYEIKIPPKYSTYEEYPTPLKENTPKILIVTGVHGPEKSGSTGVVDFIDKLLNSDDETFVSLKANFVFKVIPCLNPWGYDNNQRNNARGINLNRNFGYNWDKQVGSNVDVKGSAPYSEKETQYLQAWLAENKDAFIYLDCHDSYTSSTPQTAMWAYTYDQLTQNVWCSVLRDITVKGLRKYKSINGSVGFKTENLIGYLGFTRTSGTITEAYFKCGIPHVATIETNRALFSDVTSEPCSKQSVEIQCNQIAETIIGIVSNLQKKCI